MESGWIGEVLGAPAKTDFYFNGNLRWSLLWDSPNTTALVVSWTLPLVWLVSRHQSRSRVPLLAIGAEVILAILVAKTYSRGGFLAVTITIAFYRLAGTHLPYFWFRGRFLAFLLILWSVGALDRIAPHYLIDDRSALNRLPVYLGALKMIAIEPKGVGLGEGGWFYAQWWQEQGGTTRYLNLLSTPLQIGAEMGIAALVALLCFILFLPAYALCAKVKHSEKGDYRQHLSSVTGACGLAWLTAGGFSSVLRSPSALACAVISCVATVLLAIFHFKNTETRHNALRAAVFCTIISLGMAGAIFSTGLLLVKKDPWRLSRHGSAWEISSIRAHEDASLVSVCLDEEVIGIDYGRAFRELATSNAAHRFQFAGSVAHLAPNSSTILVLGRMHTSLNAAPRATIILVCPSGVPAEESAQEIRKVVLGGWDEKGVNAQWKEWAARRGVDLLELPGVGQNIRRHWPETVRQILQE